MRRSALVPVLVFALACFSASLPMVESAKPGRHWGTYQFQDDIQSENIEFYARRETKKYQIIVGTGSLTFTDVFGEYKGDHTGEVEVEMCPDRTWALFTFEWKEKGKLHTLQGKMDYIDGTFTDHSSFGQYKIHIRVKRTWQVPWTGEPKFHMHKIQ